MMPLLGQWNILLNRVEKERSEMNGLNFAIVGFGKMGNIRYNTLKEMQGCRVSWICEVDSAKKVPNGVKYTRNVEDVLNDKSVAAIVVSTSNDMLKEYVVKGLNSGKHVFCEKPPGRNLTELNEMIEAEKRNPQLKLMFGFNHRHHDSMIYAKKVIGSGELGKILWLRGRYGKSVNKDFHQGWRAKHKIAGGGIFLDQGIHMLDLFLMMVGDFDEVKAYVSNLYWNLDVEDNVFAIFKNKKGQVASLHSTMTQWRHLFALEIFMEKGHIVINGLLTSSGAYGQEQLSIARNSDEGPAITWNAEERRDYSTNISWANEIKIFFDCIENNSPIPKGNSQDAYKLMRLVDMVYSQK